MVKPTCLKQIYVYVYVYVIDWHFILVGARLMLGPWRTWSKGWPNRTFSWRESGNPLPAARCGSCQSFHPQVPCWESNTKVVSCCFRLKNEGLRPPGSTIGGLWTFGSNQIDDLLGPSLQRATGLTWSLRVPSAMWGICAGHVPKMCKENWSVRMHENAW